WQNLSNRKSQSQDTCWCLVGDFNCIRHPLERIGNNRGNSDAHIIADFNEWLADMEVDDIPCMGKPFTWMRPNGTCKSKLDRVLVSDGWLAKWPDSSQLNLERNYSDHCPIILKSKSIDWGPNPFKVFDEGDNNNLYFHKLINYSRRRNTLRGLLIDGTWVEDPLLVRAEVLQHFQNRFYEPQLHRPTLDGVSFSVLTSSQRDIMVEPFKEEEVTCAVWSCGNDKSPGPDGFNFRFIKHFWKEFKPDFLRFIAEFFVNACFPKGSNSSFIALIPKVKDPQAISDFRPISLIGCGNREGKKIAWISWSHCYTSRDMGGLGIKDIKILNKALLFKWKWMMFHQPNHLW
ncbi:Transposon TX1 putative 149 kDa protein, partial [Glycine soja]